MKEKIKKYCPSCGKEVSTRNIYCNNVCQHDYAYKQYIERWQNGEEEGLRGTQDLSKHIRRYLFEKSNNLCSKCGWGMVNPFTDLVPLQVHHVDGDCLNNLEENLELLCPNCHSLTDNYGSRNKNSIRNK